MKKLIPLILLIGTSVTVAGCSKNEYKPTGPGYHRAEMTMISSDMKSSYAPSKGDVKMLVVPITFAGTTALGYTNKIQKWTDEKISNMNSYYFGESNSLASYYDTASFGQLKITGMVTKIYENTTISIKTILNSTSAGEVSEYTKLWDMLDEALNWVYTQYDDINWAEYDKNQDGCIDNIHFITDYTSTTWNEALWPHMFYTGRKGTIEKPMVDVYSVSGTGFVNNSITATHEQGHIFGLEDYYDYTDGSDRDYVGGADMQSYNVFDWNSFSKMSMGWVTPYVVDGTNKDFEITMSAASLNGDCLVIPADYSTWNGSSFDEYFLVELFSPYGNNAKDWTGSWKTNLGEYGVRLYHVDGRSYGSNTLNPENHEILLVDDMEAQEINSKEDVKKWDYITHGANNCYDYLAYEGGIEQLKDNKLLAIIQAGGVDSFGKNGGRHTLNKVDLFREGSTFKFATYNKFLSKLGNETTVMDNGEEFHWEIEFTKMSAEEVTMHITYK